MSGSEPWALTRMKKMNDEAARLKREEELVLRTAAVTSWFARAEQNPGANAKAETAALEGCARALIFVSGWFPRFFHAPSPPTPPPPSYTHTHEPQHGA